MDWFGFCFIASMAMAAVGAPLALVIGELDWQLARRSGRVLINSGYWSRTQDFAESLMWASLASPLLVLAAAGLLLLMGK